MNDIPVRLMNDIPVCVYSLVAGSYGAFFLRSHHVRIEFAFGLPDE